MVRNVLVVDDSQVDRSRLEKLVADAGYLVSSAANGAQALEMAKRTKPDLVLMDINMPEMDGYQATEEIRAMDLPLAREVPIIAMTANVFQEDIERCLAAGMNDHVGKPMDIGKLMAKLKHYL